VTDIEKTLEAARSRADKYGQLYGAFCTADDHLKTTYAILYDEAPEGTVPEKDAWVKRQPSYTASVERKKDACAQWKAAEAYLKILLAEVDVWRSKEATGRWLDKGHA
jgi:hypothetical protein